MENETEAIVLPPVGQGGLAQKPWPFAGGGAFLLMTQASTLLRGPVS
jgi:hypothetical protein